MAKEIDKNLNKIDLQKYIDANFEIKERYNPSVSSSEDDSSGTIFDIFRW